jgi:hypothetical protein
MQALTILTTLREEIAEAERTTTHAWECYYSTISKETLTQAVETTKRMAALHRQIATRLEQVVEA